MEPQAKLPAKDMAGSRPGGEEEGFSNRGNIDGSDPELASPRF
jgi:hypothetical protein